MCVRATRVATQKGLASAGRRSDAKTMEVWNAPRVHPKKTKKNLILRAWSGSLFDHCVNAIAAAAILSVTYMEGEHLRIVLDEKQRKIYRCHVFTTR